MKLRVLFVLIFCYYSHLLAGPGTSGGNPSKIFYNQLYNYYINYFESYNIENNNNHVLISDGPSFVSIKSYQTLISDIDTFINEYAISNCRKNNFNGLIAFICPSNRLYVFIPKYFIHKIQFSNDKKAKEILNTFKTPLSLIRTGSKIKVLKNLYSSRYLYFQDGNIYKDKNQLNPSKAYCEMNAGYTIINDITTFNPISFSQGSILNINSILGGYNDNYLWEERHRFKTNISFDNNETDIYCKTPINVFTEISIFDFNNIFSGIFDFEFLNTIPIEIPSVGRPLARIGLNIKFIIEKELHGIYKIIFQLGQVSDSYPFHPKCTLRLKENIYTIPVKTLFKVKSKAGNYGRIINYNSYDESLFHNTFLFLEDNPYLRYISCQPHFDSNYEATDINMINSFGDWVKFYID